MTHHVMLPCEEALLAGTLALMTAYSRPLEPTHEPARLSELGQRHLLARKIVSNLFFLGQHPSLSEGLRSVVGKVHHHWQQILSQAPLPMPQSSAGESLSAAPTCAGHPPVAASAPVTIQ